MPTYYMLIERHENGHWGPAFGDYDREVVEDELQDYRDQGKKRGDLAIIHSEDNARAIAAAVVRFEEDQQQRALAVISEMMTRGK